MDKRICPLMALMLITVTSPIFAIEEDTIELKTTFIKGNKELPKILYLVPWKETKISKPPKQELVLHSLYGDLFDPVLPNQ